MSVKLNYSKKISGKISSNLVLFCDEKYKTIGLKKYVSDNEFSTSSATQTDFEGTALDISSYSTDQFNALQLKYRTLEETQVVASRIRAQVDYTAAAVTTTPYLKLGLGRYKIAKGRLKVV